MTDLPQEAELLALIVDKSRASAEFVRDTLADAGVSLARPLPASRSLVVRRLFVRGIKTGTTEGSDGPFERDIRFAPGSWAIASNINSAGKSTMLWALTWPLRGASDETYERPDSPHWFDYIRVDAEVSGVPVSFRIRLRDGVLVAGALLTADSVDHLLAVDGDIEAGPGVRVVESVNTQEAYAALVSRFMLQRLSLPALHVYSAHPGALEEDGERDGATQVHGWPAYFSVISLASGSDSMLFGRTAVGQLPMRYMQVFLDVPFAADIMSADSSVKEAGQATRHVARRSSADAAAREQQFQPLYDELARAETRLAEMRSARPDLPARVIEAQRASRAVLPLQGRVSKAQSTRDGARQLRIADERELTRSVETAAARALFGALDPHSCPRCETRIGPAQRRREAQQNQCAVCAAPLAVGEDDAEEREAALGELRGRLAASRAAEDAASDALRDAEVELASAEAAAKAAVAAAEAETGQADYLAQLRTAELEVARFQGALEVVSRLGANDEPDDQTQRVLGAAKEILSKVAGDATREMFAELNGEIVALARQLGVTNLKSVFLDLAGRINAIKSGNTKPTPFKKFSPGERLRLRIAIVISLIRVGRRHGIHSHPGMLIIDSPADVEIVPGDVKILLDQIRQLGDRERLQVITATAHEAVWDTFPTDRIVSGPDGQHLF